MKKFYQAILLVVAALFVQSCYYDEYPEYEDIDPGDGGGVEISYSNDIQPLWNDYCVDCHKGSVPPNLEADVSYSELLDGYVVPGDADASILYKSLLGEDGVSLMPPGAPWPNSRINLVKNWINQGANNN